MLQLSAQSVNLRQVYYFMVVVLSHICLSVELEHTF